MAGILAVLAGCCRETEPAGTIPIVSWAGIPADKSEPLFRLHKEAGFDWHLGLYRSQEEALTALDAAAECGVGLIPGFPGIKDDTENAVAAIREHPALVAYHLKDEPETWDIGWLAELNGKVRSLDPGHPSYINLYPDWAWGGDKYAEHIEMFASQVDVPFYSFDQYPVTEKDGRILVRPTWYRNLEVFSEMARRHGKPFWAFALAESHHLGAPSPEAFYPVPALGHLRLQVFSDLLYGAQAIQYFTFLGLYDPATLEKTCVFDLVRQVNAEIKAYSRVFYGCSVKGVWHTGENIPFATKRLRTMPHGKVKDISVSGEGGVVSLIENSGKTYIAVQNRDCVNPAILEISFAGKTDRITVCGDIRFDGKAVTLEPGDMAIFRL